MLYNRETGKVWKNTDCLFCKYFNKQTKKCEGFGKNCFEYDEKTKTAIDPVTHMPIRLDKIK